MDINTLQKLQKNPHYHLNVKQKQELEEHERQLRVEMQPLNVHSNKIPKQTGKPKKVRRFRKG